MDLKQIKELMASMGRAGIKKLGLKTHEFELQLEREGEPVYKVFPAAADEEATVPSTYQTPPNHPVGGKVRSDIPPAAVKPGAPSDPNKAVEEGVYITSPMVGTFYSASGPDDPPFTKIGDSVDKHTVVCIVEAMKVMNEVKANVSGVVQEVLVESGHPVEFGTKLFRIL